MAKSTHSQEVLTGTSDSYTNHELSDEYPPLAVQRAMLGEMIAPLNREGEQLAGMDSSEFSENEQMSGEPGNPNLRTPAQTTASPSSQLQPADSSVPLTDGNGQMETPPPYDEWTVAELQAELRERELPTTGKKAELIDRLTEDDEEVSELDNDFE